ncbi:quinolinate synthase NadA [Desulfothermus naphthae]
MKLSDKIQMIKDKLKDELCILAHHYQRDDIVKHANFIGDSLELARKVPSLEAKYIIMCGVYFMAESTAILANESQRVFIPVKNAGCTLADLAPAKLIEITLTELNKNRKIIPIAYVNTSAKVKAICGKFGGSVCTSANSVTMLKWAMENSDGVLFLPDRNLALNTAKALGIDDEEISYLDGDISNKKYKLYVWPGHCDVHLNFRKEHIHDCKKHKPDAKIIVHPECIPEVVNEADAWGSTSKIIKYVQSQPQGTKIIIGTEIHMVNRLKEQHKDKQIFPLFTSSCKYMEMINESNLLSLLENLDTYKQVEVNSETKELAKIAISKMLDVCR